MFDNLGLLTLAPALNVQLLLDGIFVGPSDLALRMQYEPEDRRLAYEDSLKKVAAACASAGIFWGTMPATVDDIRMQVALGATMLVWGADSNLLRLGLNQCASDLDAVLTNA